MARQMIHVIERVLTHLKLSILLAKMGKPLNPRLIFLKKTKKLNLMRHYNYKFIKEYEFSGSSTPLIQRYRSPFKKKMSRRDMYSILRFCQCSGSLRVEEENEVHLVIEALPEVEDDGGVKDLSLEIVDLSNEEYSVDERAEMFIRRFYDELKFQRQEGVLYLEGNA